ncbi:MAG: heavy metal-binding domain-containing protein, partial [Flavobacteriales bacterium]
MKNNNKASATYYCPMHCEGDKTYHQPADCPVCGMHLVEEISTVTTKTAAGDQFTCPMHPEIIQEGPGNCPKCGMNLVPLNPSSKEDLTYQSLLKKLKVAVVFTLPVLLIVMVEMVPNNPITKYLNIDLKNWLQLFFALPVVFYSCWMFFEKAWLSFKTRNLNMFSLIGLGAGAAFVFSCVALIFPDVFPDEFKNADGSVFLYFEAVT